SQPGRYRRSLYGGLFYGFIVCGKVRVKHPGYKIIGFVNIEL
ncbi:hypothetical protein LTSEINV_1122, partial [Salmonella enterica subsp. enterica serovar Inverness str. R8-3668]